MYDTSEVGFEAVLVRKELTIVVLQGDLEDEVLTLLH
jgi:hypothetical protein